MEKTIDLDKVEEKVYNFILKESLLEMGDSIVLSISGGSDSFALSEILYVLSPIFKLNLHLVYIDHHVRKDTTLEKKLITEYAKERDLPFTFLEIFPLDLSENSLREERYKSLLSFAEKNNFKKIALGHTLDDHIETIIMNFLRGYGLESISGIPAKRDKFIRPILVLSKEDTREYCQRKSIKYIDDFTNLLPITLRNKIRYQLIPFLKDNIKQFPESIISQSKVFYFENLFLKKLTMEYLDKIERSNNTIEIDEELWKNIPEAIKLRLIKEIISKLGEKPSLSSIFYILDKLNSTNNRTHLAEIGKVKIYRYNKKICFYKKDNIEYEYVLSIPGEIRLPTGEIIEAKIIENSNISINFQDLWQAYFDYDKIKTKALVIRTWKEGDKIRPFGLKGKSKKLHDIFIDKKIPKWKRKLIPVILLGSEVLWIPGIVRSDIATISESTKNILLLKVKKEV